MSDSDLLNPEFIRDVRNFAAVLPVSPSAWLDYILNLHAHFDGCFITRQGHQVRLKTEIFLATDAQIDAGRGKAFDARIVNWFKETFATSVPSHVRPHVRQEGRERFRIVATILRAGFPKDALMWGVRPANDNEPKGPL